MNPTDFHHLLAAPAVSRTTFFTKLLVKASPRPQVEPPFDEGAPEGLTDRLPTAAASSTPAATGFPA